MYGLLLEAIYDCLRARYGEELLSKIRSKAGIKEVSFNTHKVYSEAIIPRLLQTTCRMTGSTTEHTMDTFGTQFVMYVSKFGYDLMLKVLGRNMRDFLNGLDNLHEYLRFSYPKIKPPSFYCENEHENGLTLNYRSRRRGFLYYVMGQIKQVGLDFYNTNVEIEIISLSEMKGKTHVVMQLHFNNSAFKRNIPKQMHLQLQYDISPEFFFRSFPFHVVFDRKMKIKSIGSSLRAVMPKLVGDNLDDVFTLVRPLVEFNFKAIRMHTNVVFEMCSQSEVGRRIMKGHEEESKKPPDAIKRLLRTRHLWGKTVAAVGKQKSNLSLCRTTFFTEPGQDLFEPRKLSITSQKSTTEDSPSDIESEDGDDLLRLRLRGQMRYIKSWDSFIFLATPVIENLDRMFELGIFINDLSMHDASRDMVLAGTQQSKELKQALNQEKHKGKKLEESMKRLDDIIQKSDELLYQMIPKVVAERLRDGGEAIDTCDSFDNVTILFSDVPRFVDISSKVQPMEIVTLLNSMYSKFDDLTDKHKVYKVETINDAYMVASGAPSPSEKHASMAADLALEMLDVVRDIPDPSGENNHIKARLGMHCGSVVTGVVGLKMPRYCFFGDTVNTASRMESTGGPMGIHVSESIKKALQGYPYILQPRGTVTIKGKGEMNTYWLKGKGDSAELPVPQMPVKKVKPPSPAPAATKPVPKPSSPKPPASPGSARAGSSLLKPKTTSPVPASRSGLPEPVASRPASPPPSRPTHKPAQTVSQSTSPTQPKSGPNPEVCKAPSPSPNPAELKTLMKPEPTAKPSQHSRTNNEHNKDTASKNDVTIAPDIDRKPDLKSQHHQTSEQTHSEYEAKAKKIGKSKSRLCTVL